MVRSPGFGSNPVHSFALFRLAFTMAPPIGLTLRTKLTRWIVLQKARRHRTSRLRLLVGTEFQDSISLPSRGSFHLSIAVLVHYRSYIIFSLGWWSSRIQSGFLVPRPTRNTIHKVSVVFAYAAFTLFDQVFKLVLLTTPIFYLNLPLISQIVRKPE